MSDNHPIHDWVVKYTPPRVLPRLKRIYWQLLFQPDVEVRSLATLYNGTIEKHQVIESHLLPMGEADRLPMASFAPRLRDGRYKVPDDYVAVLHDVLYCPVNSVVMTEPGKIIAESLCAGISMKPFPRRQSTLKGYCTPWRTPKNNYYHTLIDNLPRLVALRDFTPGGNQTVRLLYSGELSKSEIFYLEKFCPAHVELLQVPKDELYRVDNLVITPFKTRRYAGYLPEKYTTPIRKALLPNRESTRKHRLLVSRVEATRRHILNQAELSAALSKLGFRTVVLEKMPVEEQIELFYDAEIVVGAHGAGLANILFGDSLKLVELFPCPHVVPHYFYLSKSLDHRYAFWCGKEESHHNDFEVDVDEILSILNALDVSDQKTANRPSYSNPVARSHTR